GRQMVQGQDRVAVAGGDAVEHEPLHGRRVVLLVPVLGIDVPADVAIAQLREAGEHPLVVHAGAKRAAEPRLRVGTGDRPDRLLGPANVTSEELVVEAVHRRVEVRVVPDQMTGRRDPPRLLRVRAHPAALEKERRALVNGRQRRQQPVLDARHGRPPRKLRVERERDPHYWASVILLSPAGWSASSPFARESAAAKSWPGTTESSGDSTGSGASGTGSRNSAPATSSAAEPDATSVAPAFLASSAAATSAGRHSSREAIVQIGNIASTAAIGPCERSVEVTDSAAIRQVSVSLSAISRAVPSSIPRPTTYIRPTNANVVASGATAASSPGSAACMDSATSCIAAATSPPRPAAQPASSPSAANVFTSVFDAATARSSPACRGSVSSAARASSDLGSFVTAIVNAPRCRARST